MTRILVISLLLLVHSIPSFAQEYRDQNEVLASYENEEITVDATAGGVGFTQALIRPTCTDCPPQLLFALSATCMNNGAEIRILTNGENAVTAASGIIIADQQSFTVFGINDINNFRAIRTGGSSSELSCQYARRP